jgi:NADH-quinone oxidoreductase subunit L
MHAVFDLSPFALECVGVVGAVTLLLAGFTALMQTDIKKILAYSTMSQIGYMFLAEGAGAYQPAVFHLMTHAFFKALLFLASGSVILAMHHEQDIFKMGGLRKKLPFVFACFMVGTLALTAFPFTAGYYSKDEILHQAYLSGHHNLWLAGLFGAFLTAVYSFRLIFITFFGPERWREAKVHGEAKAHGHDDHGHANDHGGGEPHGARTFDHHIPLAVLIVFSIIGGFIHLPLAGLLPEAAIPEGDHGPAYIAHLPLVVSLLGIFVSWLLFHQAPQIPAALKTNAATAWIGKLWKSAWGFDWLYDVLFERPFKWVANVNRSDFIDQLIGLIPASLRGAGTLATATQTGGLRWYAAVAGAGICVLIAVVALH